MEKQIKKLKITFEQYRELQAMSNAASRDYSRLSLTYVYYDKAEDQFVATDGHILRMEKFQWIEDAPEASFFLEPDQIMLTQPQLKLRHARHRFGATVKLLRDVPLEIEYDLGSAEQYGPYPNYKNVIPKPEDAKEVKSIAIYPALFARFKTTFSVQPKSMRMEFRGELGAITTWTRNEDGEDIMRGIIMPTRHTAR